MNCKKYVKKICSNCINRNNKIDLCNIVRTIDGNYKCNNEKIQNNAKRNKEKNRIYTKRSGTAILCLLMCLFNVTITIFQKDFNYILYAFLWSGIALIEYLENKLIEENENLIKKQNELIIKQLYDINELTEKLEQKDKLIKFVKEK